MAELTDALTRILDGHTNQIATQIGTDPSQARSALQAAIPTLLAAVSHQANNGTGIQQAIQNDHDGAILNDVAGYLNGTANLSPNATNGSGIVRHLLGDAQPAVQQQLSAQTGLSPNTIAQLLPLLAPLVLGMIGRQAQQSPAAGGLDLSKLGSALSGEAQSAPGQIPDIGKLLGEIAGPGSTGGSGGLAGLGNLLESLGNKPSN